MVFIPSSIENIKTFYFLSALFAFFIFQNIIIAKNKNYIALFVVVLLLLIYEVYQRQNKIKKDFFDKKENFIMYAIDLTKENDTQNGLKKRNYKKTLALLKSETILWKTLQQFKSVSQTQPKAYEKIIIQIIHFYEDYSFYLKNKINNMSSNAIITDMIMKRQEIMNSIQEYNLQHLITYEMNKSIKSISIIILACLDKCIRVLRKRYQEFHSFAPYAFNIMGDEFELY